MKSTLAHISRILKTTPVVFIFVLLACVHVNAQTNIGGVINTYTKVSSVSNGCSCPTTNCATVTVSSATGFAANDIVLLIQMKGARADSSNTNSHGTILNLYDAGNYEFDTIASIAGSVITLKVPLKNTYFTNSNPTDSAYVQLIRVPVYSGDVNVTSTLSPQAWNATTGTGGVLVFWLTGTLTLQANISANGLGFHAARRVVSSVSCGNDTAFYYQSTTWQHSTCTSCGYAYSDSPTRLADVAAYGGCGSPCSTNRMNSQDNRFAGFRGEGVVANTFKKTFANSNIAIFDKGRARWGTGGGGGGNHNAGGGGGGNYGAGGTGGNAYNTTGCTAGTILLRKGLGGMTVTPTATKIYMGGGGGEGHDNAGQGSTGTVGGGIIMIKAAIVTNSASYTISANGADNLVNATSDGSGGGGAGGTILMDVSGSYTNAVTLSAIGGIGGDNSQSNCHGPGGGGGGGVLWFSTTGGSVPANVTTSVAGGASGTNYHPSFDCGTASWGSTAGGAGWVTTGLASGATVFFNMNDCSSALPVELLSFNAAVLDDNIYLDWTTATEINNDYFIIQRRTETESIRDYMRVEGAGNTTIRQNYYASDMQPFNGTAYYRLVQVDFDGRHSYFDWKKVSWHPEHSILVSPVPFRGGLLHIGLPVIPVTSCRISINNISGKIIYDNKIPRELFSDNLFISEINFPYQGIYMLNVEIDGKGYHEKISVAID